MFGCGWLGGVLGMGIGVEGKRAPAQHLPDSKEYRDNVELG